MTEVRTVVVEREFPHPQERVWRALTQPHLVEEWLMKNDFKSGVGERFRLSGDWGGVDCEILVSDPHDKLSYRWDYAHEDPHYALKSVVTFTLTSTGKGTHLRMEQVGFRPDQKQALGGAIGGWHAHLDKLAQVLEREG
jgi:uncharacterized protein YndB with AHSA1/START domain